MFRSRGARFLLLVSLGFALSAETCDQVQPFSRSYPDLMRWSIPTSDGFFLAGWTQETSPSRHLLLRRTDFNGAEIWTHEVTELEPQPSIFGIRQASDGGFLVWGYYPSPTASNEAFVLKVASDGHALWTRTFGGPGVDYANYLVETPSAYVVAGATNSSGAGDFDIWVVRLDLQGNIVGQSTFGGTGDDEAEAMDSTPDGGFIVAGQNPSVGKSAGHIEVLRFGPNGALAWKVFLGTPGNFAEAAAVASTPDGGFAVSGSEDVSQPEPPFFSTSIGHLFKLTSTGAVQWSADSTDNGRTGGAGIVVAADGTTVQTRWSRNQYGLGAYASLTRYSATGSVLAHTLWQVSQPPWAGGYGPDTLVPTADGGFAFESSLFDGTVWHANTATKVNSSLEQEWEIDWTGDPGDVRVGGTIDGWFVVCGAPPAQYASSTASWLVRPATTGEVVPAS